MFTRPHLYLSKVLMKKTRTSTARSTTFVEAAKWRNGGMSTIKDSNDEDLISSGSAMLAPSLATSTTARARINNIAARAYSNAIEGRQIAAPPWSAACMTDHGPSECDEPMWIYGSRSEIARYRNAF